MFNQMMNSFGTGWGMSSLLLLVYLWTLPWKAWALWIAARKGQRVWFAVLLVVNTLAILEILYIFVFSKAKPKETKQK
jgi:hypothetical protein